MADDFVLLEPPSALAAFEPLVAFVFLVALVLVEAFVDFEVSAFGVVGFLAAVPFGVVAFAAVVEPRRLVRFSSPIGSALPTALTAPLATSPTVPAILPAVRPAVRPTRFTTLPGSGMGWSSNWFRPR